MCNDYSVQLEEYKALMEEHRRNRSYVFERTIVILGGIAASIKLFDANNPLFVSLFLESILMIIFSYNLIFTVHRLKSDARIIAYIHVFHEGSFSYKWFGWENALRDYRIWLHDNQETLPEILEEKNDKKAIPHVKKSEILIKGGYPGLWVLHMCFVALAWVFGIATTCKKVLASLSDPNSKGLTPLIYDNVTPPNVLGILVLVIATCYFLYSAFGPSYYSKIEPFIENEKTIWEIIAQKSKRRINNA